MTSALRRVVARLPVEGTVEWALSVLALASSTPHYMKLTNTNNIVSVNRLTMLAVVAIIQPQSLNAQNFLKAWLLIKRQQH
jgi:hypothetical protein